MAARTQKNTNPGGHAGERGKVVGLATDDPRIQDRAGSATSSVADTPVTDESLKGPVKALRWLRYWLKHPEVKGAESRVLAFWAVCLDNDRGTAFPSIDAIEAGTGLNRRSIVAARNTLAEIGAVIPTCRICGPLQDCPQRGGGHVVQIVAVLPPPENQPSLFDDDEEEDAAQGKWRNDTFPEDTPSKKVAKRDQRRSRNATKESGKTLPELTAATNSGTNSSSSIESTNEEAPPSEVEDEITLLVDALFDYRIEGGDFIRNPAAWKRAVERDLRGDPAKVQEVREELGAAEPEAPVPQHLEEIIGTPTGQRIEDAVTSLLRAHQIMREFREFEFEVGMDRDRWTPEDQARWDDLHDRTGGGPFFAMDAAQRQFDRIEFGRWSSSLQSEALGHYVEVAGEDYTPTPECRCRLCRVAVLR